MTPNNDKEKLLDQIIDDVRSDLPAEETVAAAADRVRQQLTGSAAGESLTACADFQALIPAYHAGELSEGRRLLAADHLRSCVSCRRALNQQQRDAATEAARAATPATGHYWKWAGIAAAVLLVALVAQMGVFSGLFVEPVWARLETASGPVYRLEDGGSMLLAPGDRIETGQWLRTARGAVAQLRLSDGSLIELNERSEFSMRSAWAGHTIDLRRGDIIVEAAEQGRGRLFVDTNELEVAVRGTVFTVGHGMKGSRVAVLEGEVLVQHGGAEKTLRAGEQLSSRERLASVEIEREVSWSPNRDQHLALIAEFAQLQGQLLQVADGQQLRTSSRLLNAVPADTVIFGAMPNISEELQQVFQAFRDRIATNPDLSDWYTTNVSPQEEVMIQLGLDRMRAYGSQLGDEIVVALVDRGAGRESPLILAETRDQQGFIDLVTNDIGLVRTLSGEEIPIQVVGSPAEATVDGLLILVSEGLVAATDSAELLAEVAANAAGGSSFAGSRFATTIENAYTEGINWLLAVNLERLSAEVNQNVEQSAAMAMIGIREIQDLVVERKRVAGVTDNRAVFTFSQVEEGLLSWVAEPGPMGGLDFVSPDAQLAAAFVVQDPASVVDRFFAFLQTYDENTWNDVLAAQSEIGLDFRNDLAAPLGGEVVVAVDGAVLPEPSWKIIVEVLDPATLQSSLEAMVGQYNTHRGADDPEAALTSSGDGHWVLGLGQGPTVEYRYASGYLIAGPSRSVVDRAVQLRQSGSMLSTAPAFLDLLPQGGATNLSGLFYHDLGSLLGPLAGQLSGLSGELTPEQEAALSSVASDMPPMMLSMIIEPGRVTIASTGDLDALWQNLGTLASLRGSGGLVEVLGAAGN